ncbi:MAG: PAS domain S-box protein [Micavibrio sp.]|nr:PAS domain S-box protein [Micavibrio sp.]
MPDISPSFDQLFQKMPIPRFIIGWDEEGEFKIIRANDLALKYFGWEKRIVQGQCIREFLDHDNAEHFSQSFEVAVSKMRPVTIQTLPGMPGNIRVYGFYITPILAEDEKTVQFLDVVGQMDVADQSILQRERDDAISLLTSIFDVSEVGIVVTDHNRHIIRVNESFIRTYGWKREELINEDLAGIVTPDERDFVRMNYDEFIKSGVHSSGEMKIIRADGSVANALFTTATMELSQSRRFQITTVMDITLRKQMEQSLRVAKDQADSSNRSKSLFLANMSHELRTPLNAILGFSEMMIDETFGPLGHAKYKEYLGDVHSSANHLLEIINEVLDMSKIEAGRIDLDEEEIEVSEMIASTLRMLDSRAFGKNVRLEAVYPENLPMLFADPRLMRQIMINLVGNAVKFSHANSTVTVEVDVHFDKALTIIVRDQGVGIPADKINEALEPFGQVYDTADNSLHQGTGLGLPLAKAMTRLHGGTLEIKSQVGKGTAIYVHMPSERSLAPFNTSQKSLTDL